MRNHNLDDGFCGFKKGAPRPFLRLLQPHYLHSARMHRRLPRNSFRPRLEPTHQPSRRPVFSFPGPRFLSRIFPLPFPLTFSLSLYILQMMALSVTLSYLIYDFFCCLLDKDIHVSNLVHHTVGIVGIMAGLSYQMVHSLSIPSSDSSHLSLSTPICKCNE